MGKYCGTKRCKLSNEDLIMDNFTDYKILENIEKELFPILKCQSFQYNGKKQCSNILVDFLKRLDLDVLFDTFNNSSIICARTNKNNKKNLLIYSHYDVKPAGCKKSWATSPFEPTIINNRIYCRGSGDAKCQIYAAIKAIEMIKKNNIRSDIGISLMLEDSEESDSINLEHFIRKYHDFLNPLFVVVVDSHWCDNLPTIGYGCRGQLSYLLLRKEKEFKHNLHAGNYGGKYNGAAFNLISCIYKFMNTRHIVEEYFNGNAAFTISGIVSGELTKGVIPATAQCGIDMRLDKQNIYDEMAFINKFFQQKNIQVYYRQIYAPFISKINKNQLNTIINTISNITGINPSVYEQIPAYLPLEKLSHLHCPIYIVPLAQSDENNHSPNENMKISHIIYGVKLIYNLYLCL